MRATYFVPFDVHCLIDLSCHPIQPLRESFQPTFMAVYYFLAYADQNWCKCLWLVLVRIHLQKNVPALTFFLKKHIIKLKVFILRNILGSCRRIQISERLWNMAQSNDPSGDTEKGRLVRKTSTNLCASHGSKRTYS